MLTDENDLARQACRLEFHPLVQIQQQVADAGTEVVHVEPDQAEQDDFRQRMTDYRLDAGKGFWRREATLKQP
jgi:hypothetical protein